MLYKLVIEGLRGFAETREIKLAVPDDQPGSGLTLLTGPNNSGKSTIIEALKVRSSFHHAPSFNVGMRNAKSDSVSIIYEVDGHQDRISSTRPGSSEATVVRQTEIAPYIVPSRRHFSPYFGRSSATSRKEYSTYAASNFNMREQSLSGFEGRIFTVERDHEEFNKLLKEVIPSFMDWSIDQSESNSYFIKLKSKSKTHSLAGSGDGIISAFVIIAALFDSSPGDVIAIDEPELSLHPSIQRSLAAVITRFSSDRQIIVSTHSPYFIDPQAILNGAEVVRTWDRSDSIEIYQLSVKSCEGLKKIISPNMNNPHVFGLDAREIFFADDPILVFEGQEDVVFWPKVVHNRPELSTISTYGWGAGGAANMSNVVDILKALGFCRVAGILDNNRPADFKKLATAFPEFCFIEIPAADVRTKPGVEARAEIIGLLNSAGHVRPELQSQLDIQLDNLTRFLDEAKH